MVAMANPLESFIWGKGGAKMTPEQIAREREIAEALGVIDTSPVGHWTQGLARVANAAAGAYRGHKANRAEQANADFNSDLSSRISSALFGGGAPSLSGSAGTSTAMATAPAPDYASARVAQAHSEPVDLSGNKEAFVSALMPAAIEASKRTGVDPRIIVAQAAQETGWGRSAPGNNFFGIKSHGKGGGQTFTTHEVINGKRVKIQDSFRKFASPADSVAGYADFLLANPRYRKMMSAQGLDAQLQALGASGYATDPNYASSVGSIARSIPLPSMDSAPAVDAVNALADGSMQEPMAYAPAPAPAAAMDPMAGGVPVAETEADIMAQEQAMAQQDPSAWAMPADPMATGSLPAPDANPSAPVASSLTGHMVNPDLPMAGGTSGFAQPSPQVAQALLGGQASAQMGGPAAPMPGMTQALIEALSDPRTSDQNRRLATMVLDRQMQQQDPMRQLEMEMMQEKLNQLRNPQPEQTAEMQNLSWRAQQAGLQPGTPEYTEFMLTGGRNDGVTVNNMGNIPAGYQLRTDPDGTQRMEPIPGSPAALEIEAAQAAAGAKQENQATSGDIITTAAANAREIANRAGRMATGTGGRILSVFGESDAAELRRQVEVLKSNAKIENLQAMRAASPTGGALGSVSNQENEMLAAKAGALDPNAGPEQFQKQLDDYERTLLRIVHGRQVGDAIFEQTRQTEANKPVSEMTDEELEALANGDR